MNQQNLFVIVSIRDNALIGQWFFLAADELAVADYLLGDPWEYQDIFWALRISTTEVQRMQPGELVQAINDSYWNRRVRAVLYLLKIEQPVDCSKVAPVPWWGKKKTEPGGPKLPAVLPNPEERSPSVYIIRRSLLPGGSLMAAAPYYPRPRNGHLWTASENPPAAEGN